MRGSNSPPALPRINAAYAVPIAVSIVLLAIHVHDPLVMDEAVFAETMEVFSRTGVPTYYAGEPLGVRDGLWHPPVYIGYIAGWFRLFGATPATARVATAVFTVATVPLVGVLTDRLIRSEGDDLWVGSRRMAVAASMVIYATHPFVIQNGTLIDIDGSVLAFLVTGYLVWLIALPDERSFGTRTALTVASWFTVLSWVKFGQLPVLLACTMGFVLLRRGMVASFIAAVAAGAGMLVFAGTWWGVATATGLDFLAPFVHNFGAVFESTAEGGLAPTKRLLLSAWGTYLEVLWVSPFLLALAVLQVHCGRGWSSGWAEFVRSRAGTLLLLAVPLLTLVQYAALAKVPYGFPKYLGIGTPALCSLAGLGVSAVIDWGDRRDIGIWIGLSGAVAIVTVIAGDPFLAPFERGYLPVVVHTAATVLTVVGLALAVGAVFRLQTSPLPGSRAKLFTIVAIVLLVGTHAGMVFAQSTADYSTRYFYGQQGMDEAVEETRDRYRALSPAQRQAVVLPLDFTFYLDGPFVSARRFTAGDLKRSRPLLIVLRTEKYYAVNSPLLERLDADPTYDAIRIGSFVVFERNLSERSKHPRKKSAVGKSVARGKKGLASPYRGTSATWLFDTIRDDTASPSTQEGLETE